MATHFQFPWRERHAGFVKRVRGFANRASAIAGFPALPITGAATTAILIVVGAFGTGLMPLGVRIAFWIVLMSWNILKWQVWFAVLIRRPTDWSRVSAIGAVVLNLPLPFEIAATLRLFGVAYTPHFSRTWIEALAISGAVLAVMLLLSRRPAPTVQPGAETPEIRPGGLLARAGLPSPAMLEGIEAEDHFCRLHLAGGRTILLHHRFRDALAEVAAFDGAQVHRGAWAAAHGVRGAVRAGRRWRIVLASGAQLPVSSSFVAGARARGWLTRSLLLA